MPFLWKRETSLRIQGPFSLEDGKASTSAMFALCTNGARKSLLGSEIAP